MARICPRLAQAFVAFAMALCLLMWPAHGWATSASVAIGIALGTSTLPSIPPAFDDHNPCTLDSANGNRPDGATYGSLGWRDDLLGHATFGAPRHVNAWGNGLGFHLWY